MSGIWSERLGGWIAWNHEEVQRAVEQIDPEQFLVRPTRSAPSVGFHAWHIGRWVDLHIVRLSTVLDPATPAREHWVADDIAARWKLGTAELGDFGGTGAGLDDDASAALPLPGREAVLDYVVATFRAFEAQLARLDDELLERTIVDPYGDETSIGEMLLNHLSHADRHLGMIEALRGVLGERGTATV
jgi:hypothetical protein